MNSHSENEVSSAESGKSTVVVLSGRSRESRKKKSIAEKYKELRKQSRQLIEQVTSLKEMNEKYVAYIKQVFASHEIKDTTTAETSSTVPLHSPTTIVTPSVSNPIVINAVASTSINTNNNISNTNSQNATSNDSNIMDTNHHFPSLRIIRNNNNVSPPTNTPIITAATTAAPTAPKEKTPPPIVAYQLNVKEARIHFRTVLGHNNFVFVPQNNNCTHVKTKHRVDYDKLKAAINQHNATKEKKEEQIEFHTFTPKEDRVISVVLRNLDHSYDADDIKQGITDLNLDVTVSHVSRYETDWSKRNKINLGHWLIQLAPGSNVNDLLKTKMFLSQSQIKFERRQNSTIPQCKNCQHFGHTASNCARHSRCVKCNADHPRNECPSTPAEGEAPSPESLFCVNCESKEHPANYRGCPVYTNIIRRKQEKAQQILEQQQLRQSSYRNFSSPQISYANTVARRSTNAAIQQQQQQQSTQHTATNQQHQSSQPTASPATAPTASTAPSSPPENCLDFLRRECNNTFQHNFADMIKRTTNFVPHYSRLPQNEKPLALLEFLLSISPAQQNV